MSAPPKGPSLHKAQPATHAPWSLAAKHAARRLRDHDAHVQAYERHQRWLAAVEADPSRFTSTHGGAP